MDEMPLIQQYMRMEGRLHSLGRDGFLREPIAEPDKPTPQPVDVASAVRGAAGQSHPLRSSIWTASASLAGCVALMLTWTLWPSSVSASSVLQKAQRAAAEMVDRTYRLVVSRPTAENGPSTHELTISVRGGGRFVIRPENGAYMIGCDGTEYWMARQDGPVCVTRDFRSLAPELQRAIPNRRLLEMVASPNEPLLLEITEVLSLIQRRYDIELVKSADAAEHHIRATLRSGKRNDPSVINFWADAKSGVVLRAEMDGPDSRQARFELIESPMLSDQWYDHQEHVPDRPVESLDTR